MAAKSVSILASFPDIVANCASSAASGVVAATGVPTSSSDRDSIGRSASEGYLSVASAQPAASRTTRSRECRIIAVV
jgi:hypothetical protein